MDDQQVRAVLLVKAMESAPHSATWISSGQQRAASEAALARAPRPASEGRSREWAEQFVSHRAQHLLTQVAHQHPGVLWLQKGSPQAAALAWALPLLALLTGWLGESLFSPGHIQLLSPALVAVLLWNWGLFAFLLLSPLRGLWQRGRPQHPAAASHRWWPLPPWLPSWGKAWWPVSVALQRDWWRVAGPSLRARWLARLHDASALFALGLMGSLAWKGLYGQYRVGWESAWIDPPLMHRLVSALATLVGSEPFSLDTLTRINAWAQPAPPEVGATWFWLVTKLLLATVVLPRWTLARLASWRARRLGRDMRLDLTEPYYVALLAAFGGPRTRLQVWPYSHTLNSTQQTALQTSARAWHGDATTVTLAPVTPYGHLPDKALPQATSPAAQPADTPHTVALFSLAATPETEAHGQFVQHLQQHTRHALEIWVDQAPLVRKWGTQGAATTRLAERTALWSAFAAHHHATLRLIELDA